MNFSELTQKIEESDVITIFRHEHPDCDACGSQFGLREWIRDNYPGKKVYACGTETCSQGRFPALEEVSDETVRQSTAIILDTANAARIDDARARTASCLIKIDHHPNREPFGEICLVNDHAAAACEILAQYFQSREDCIVSNTTAEYLYQGLLTDTLNFSTSNTTSHTLAMASYLSGFGVKIPELNRYLFDRSLPEFRFAGHIRNEIQMIGEHMAYVLLDLKDLQEWNMTAGEARNYVTELGHVREFEVWAIFTETDPGVYAASLRSKTAAVSGIAEEYGGGGHRNASGIKGLSLDDIRKMLVQLQAAADAAAV